MKVVRKPIIIVGGGHAGCEAAWVCARKGFQTILISFSIERIAHLSCNPAIGGVSKGHMVKEIDALGGIMGVITDRNSIQSRLLNTKKGPAVQATRSQVDSVLYPQSMQNFLKEQSLIQLLEDEVLSINLDNQDRIYSVITQNNGEILCSAAIITTGTFLKGLCHIGMESFEAGRIGDSSSKNLSSSLRDIGFQLGRLKTGTTPRIKKSSIDFSKMEEQIGDLPLPTFSFIPQRNPLQQISCYLTQTNPTTHEVILSGLDKSPLFSGKIEGIGPRYCPSIEDKITRFPDKTNHHVFLEPESLSTDLYYPSGLSTSLPLETQYAYLHSIPGLERAHIAQPGYAVEYDYVIPTQLAATLMSLDVPGLFFAGQINGTSGYEEAAAQGLLAGINACQFLEENKPVILSRHQAYSGVLIDDLVTNGTNEPYRMFTSRAEFRLLLREDNADLRLTPLGRELGIIDDHRWEIFSQRQKLLATTEHELLHTQINPNPKVNQWLIDHGASTLKKPQQLHEILRRPEIKYDFMVEPFRLPKLNTAEANTLSYNVKYAGYIERQSAEIEKMAHLEKIEIPANFDFSCIPGLSNEVQQKLFATRPGNLAQAQRISGITPAAISILRIWIQRTPHHVSRET